ncbi:MAG: inner membrane CreD family protein [Sandaracinaceae bacterium]
MRRLIGIAAVWAGCAVAWMVLGSTLVARSTDTFTSGRGNVYALWGPRAVQRQPSATVRVEREVEEQETVTNEAGQRHVVSRLNTAVDHRPAPLRGSDLTVDLDLEHRRRGLNWYATYVVDFDGRYTFENPTDQALPLTVAFPLTDASAVFDGFRVLDDAGRELEVTLEQSLATWTVEVGEGERRTFRVAYRSRGTETWHYRMADGTAQVEDFHLRMTADAAAIDFPEGSLSPTEHAVQGGGWVGRWDFDHLIASQPIGVELPARLNPGPLAARITFFAPVGLLFFFLATGILALSRNRDLHPMHYVFFGCGFFAFHLLFAYLVDHLPIGLSFALGAATSLALVVTYARLFTGWRFAVLYLGGAQLLYLVLFSTTFLWEGFTGLAISVGAVLTLAVMMQITGRMRWGGPKAEPAPAPSEGLTAEGPLPAMPPAGPPTAF